MRTLNRLRGSGTIQSRVLAIALIPSIAIMLVGVVLSGYLAYQGISTRSFADNVRSSLGPSTRLIHAVQEERRLTTVQLNDPGADRSKLAERRRDVDTALVELSATVKQLAEDAPDELRQPLQLLDEAARDMPGMRQRADFGAVTPQQVYDFYGDLVDFVGLSVQGIARSATDAEVGFEQMISSELFRSVEAQARSHALVERAMARGLDEKEFHELSHQMGTYHELIETIVPRLTEQERKDYTDLKASPAWKTLNAGDDSMMAKGPGKHPVDFDVAGWEDAHQRVSEGLLKLYAAHSAYAADLGTSRGGAVLTASLAAGGTILLLAVGAMLFALRQSRTLIRRLAILRRDTLEVAEHKLPDVVARIGRGERVDVESELPTFDHGDDEIGQVARAFEKAQRFAVSAAAEEAETRQGVRSVFLNMAHRNQVMVHKQLQVLDRAERSEEDPDQLALLFQLDHLATRSRRNAESLIILGGKRPGRQWRNPVPLLDVVRGAVSETEHYSRVDTGSLPDVKLAGTVVADVIHLLAELVDNATAFSPSETHVAIMATQVGRGVVVEIEDQGQGIQEERLAELNKRLQSPPDFGVMALTGETRIGLFVVGQLAARNGIKVALRESIYGGVQAVVLLPNDLIVEEPPVDQTATIAPVPVASEPRQAPFLNRRTPGESLASLSGSLPVQAEPRFPGEQEQAPDRSRSTLAAFQQGVQQARGPARPGGEA